MPVGVEEPGIASIHPAVRPLCLGRSLWISVITPKRSRAFEQYLAILGNADLDALDRWPNRVGLHIPVLLDAQENGAFGHPVELLQIDPEGAVEDEKIGPDRLTCGVGDADAAEAESILQRTIDQQIAEPI